MGSSFTNRSASCGSDDTGSVCVCVLLYGPVLMELGHLGRDE